MPPLPSSRSHIRGYARRLFAVATCFVSLFCWMPHRNISVEANGQEITPKLGNTPLKFLALGDSYTIGESVDAVDRWPVQLKHLLADENIFLNEPRIVAKTGWTTDELQAAIDNEELNDEYDLVTLLIGVNNQYRQRPIATYKPELEKLLKQAIYFAKGRPERVILVSIPDYGVTPFVAKKFQENPGDDSKFNPAMIARNLDSYNAAARQISKDHGVHWIDITGVSRESGHKSEMLADDGLHPSASMYTLWAREIAPVVALTLKESKP